MHWIQNIRAHLQISQDDLAAYLGLSQHMLQSVELGRRQLPLSSLRPAMVLFQAVMASKAGDIARGYVTTPDQRTRRRKHLYGQYHRKLVLCERRLEAMQRAYDTAIINLGIYQQTAQALNEPDDAIRRRWTERKIEETAHQVKEHDTGAQDPLHLQITVLKGITRQLGEPLNPAPDE